MFVIGNLIGALAHILEWLLRVLQIAVFLRVVFSWVNADPYNGIVRAVGAITDPILAPFRKLLPPWKLHGWDLSPVFAFLTLLFLQLFLVQTLYDLAARMG
jgi:YggT family protein